MDMGHPVHPGPLDREPVVGHEENLPPADRHAPCHPSEQVVRAHARGGLVDPAVMDRGLQFPALDAGDGERMPGGHATSPASPRRGRGAQAGPWSRIWTCT